MDRQTSHPSCGFYAASYVLNCFNPDAAWTNMELLKLAVQYPLTNRAEGCLSEVGEVFHPHDFARFIHARANGSCSAACQLFHEQTIRDTIDQGGYALVPFQVINDKQNEKHGFPGLASSGRTFRMHIGALLPDMQQRITPNCSPSTGEKTGYLI
ncbi:hypothetical protein PVA48_00960 [Akkermansia sp. JRP_AM1]|uniref:hypothetical protein n=1 Tax=Akkermansia sp. JRP_AM1 TaxID=3414159 RepID=UPI003BFA69CB